MMYKARDKILNLSKRLQSKLTQFNVKEFTKFQENVFSLFLKSTASFLALAPTGSGKTLSYLLPLITEEEITEENVDTTTLIILPTRDLACQVYNEFKKYLTETISLTLIIGGRSVEKDIKNLSKIPKFIIGTPGRLFFHEKTLKKLHIKHLVLDEVDRLYDVGFKKEIAFFMERYSYSRKMLFSATFSKQIKKQLLKNDFNPVIIDTCDKNHEKISIKELFLQLEEKQKFFKLLELLKTSVASIIFLNSKAQVKKLTKNWFKKTLNF